MKIGFQIFLYCFLLNLVGGLGYTLQIAGSQRGFPLLDTVDIEDYTDRVDPERMINQTNPETSEILTFLGHIYSATLQLFNAVRFVLLGLYDLLMTLGSIIPDAAARSAFSTIAAVIQGAVDLVILGWIYQLISGRRIQD